MVPPKDTLVSKSPVPQHMTLLGVRVFVVVVKLKQGPVFCLLSSGFSLCINNASVRSTVVWSSRVHRVSYVPAALGLHHHWVKVLLGPFCEGPEAPEGKVTCTGWLMEPEFQARTLAGSVISPLLCRMSALLPSWDNLEDLTVLRPGPPPEGLVYWSGKWSEHGNCQTSQDETLYS